MGSSLWQKGKRMNCRNCGEPLKRTMDDYYLCPKCGKRYRPVGYNQSYGNCSNNQYQAPNMGVNQQYNPQGMNANCQPNYGNPNGGQQYYQNNGGYQNIPNPQTYNVNIGHNRNVSSVCPTCGTNCHPYADVCPSCGTTVNTKEHPNESTIGWAFLGFFFPYVAFILWLVWRKDYPRRSHALGKGALISFIMGAVALIIYLIFLFAVILAVG